MAWYHKVQQQQMSNWYDQKEQQHKDKIAILEKNVHDLQEQLNAAHKRIKSLVAQNADAMVIIGHKQQELDAMEQARDNAYDDISTLTEDINANQ